MNCDTQHNETRAIMLSVVMLNVAYAQCLKNTLYADCSYAECRGKVW